MVKQISVIVIVLLCISILAGCGQSAQIEAQYNQVNEVDADWKNLANSPEELPQVSDLVVLFKPETQENKLSFFSDGLVFDGYTLTTGRVTKVLQGSVEVNAQIQVTEASYTQNNGTELWTISGYLPMQKGEEYLLFLKAYETDSAFAGLYRIVDITYGKYIPGVNAARNFEIASNFNTDRYAQWFQVVKEMYPEVFDE